MDRLLNQQKFSRMVQKKEIQQRAQQAANQWLPQNFRQPKQMIIDESLSEIEEETNPNVNNGMI